MAPLLLGKGADGLGGARHPWDLGHRASFCSQLKHALDDGKRLRAEAMRARADRSRMLDYLLDSKQLQLTQTQLPPPSKESSQGEEEEEDED